MARDDAARCNVSTFTRLTWDKLGTNLGESGSANCWCTGLIVLIQSHTLQTETKPLVHNVVVLYNDLCSEIFQTFLLNVINFYAPQLYRQVLLRRVLAMAILSVRPSVCHGPVQKQPSDIETPGLHHMIA